MAVGISACTPRVWETDIRCRRAFNVPVVVKPWATSIRDIDCWKNYSNEMTNLFSPLVFLAKATGRGLTSFTHHLSKLICLPCDNVRERWHLEDALMHRARVIVDGPDDRDVEANYDVEMFLEYAPDVVQGAVDFEDSAHHSLAIQHPHRLEVGPHVVSNNYVIKKGKRGFYCHYLLSLLKSRLGVIPHDALHEKIVRRNAHKECDNHGLRPRDKLLAVEFVVKMYWIRNKYEREIDLIAGSYEPYGGSWIRRAFKRFKRSFGLTTPMGIHE